MDLTGPSHLGVFHPPLRGSFPHRLVLKCSRPGLTRQLSIARLLFLLISVGDGLFGQAQQRLILPIDASVFVLPPPFCSHAELFEAAGIQSLSASAALPLPLACSLFLRWPKYFPFSKGELVFILRWAFVRCVSSQRVQA